MTLYLVHNFLWVVGMSDDLNRFCGSWGHTACLHPIETSFLIHSFSTDSMSDRGGESEKVNSDHSLIMIATVTICEDPHGLGLPTTGIHRNETQ